MIPPLAVNSPVDVSVPATPKLLLTVVVPDVAPIEIVVAAPPIFKVDAIVLKREAAD